MIIDIVVIAVLLISAAIAFARGFIREVLTILGVVGGVVAAYSLGGLASVYTRQWMGVQEGAEPEKLFDIVPYNLVADALAYGGVFILVVITLSILSHFLAESVKSLGLGAIDRTFGVIFGLARGALLLGLLYLPVYMLADKETKASWFEGSRSFFYLEQTAAVIEHYLPEAARAKAEEGLEKVQDANGTREALEQIRLLPSAEEGAGQQKEQPAEQPAAAPGAQRQDGYSDEFRRTMDRLIDDRAGAGNE